MSEKVLEKYDYLIAEASLEEDFKNMECWKKLCTEIEIYTHCSYDPNEEFYPACKWGFIDCRHCQFVKPTVLKEINTFADELRTAGYFVYRNIRWWLIVSKIRSIAQCISQAFPLFMNAGIRGLVFGYSIDEIKEWIKKSEQDGLKE